MSFLLKNFKNKVYKKRKKKYIFNKISSKTNFLHVKFNLFCARTFFFRFKNLFQLNKIGTNPVIFRSGRGRKKMTSKIFLLYAQQRKLLPSNNWKYKKKFIDVNFKYYNQILFLNSLFKKDAFIMLKDVFTKTIFFNNFIKVFMKHGKKSLWYKLLLNTFFFSLLTYKIPINLFLFKILYNLRLPLNIKSKIKSGRFTYMPIILSPKRQYVFACLLFKKSVLGRSEISFSNKFLSEIIELLFNSSGYSFSKLNNMVTVALENKTNIRK